MDDERRKHLDIQKRQKEEEIKRQIDKENKKKQLKAIEKQQKEKLQQELFNLQVKNEKEKEVLDKIIAQNAKLTEHNHNQAMIKKQNERMMKQKKRDEELSNIVLSKNVFPKKMSA